MRTRVATYQLDERASPIAALVEMVARKGPMLERVGGLIQNSRKDAGRIKPRAPSVTKEGKARFAELLTAGRTLREVAAETGYDYQVVLFHTKKLRGK